MLTKKDTMGGWTLLFFAGKTFPPKFTQHTDDNTDDHEICHTSNLSLITHHIISKVYLLLTLGVLSPCWSVTAGSPHCQYPSNTNYTPSSGT